MTPIAAIVRLGGELHNGRLQAAVVKAHSVGAVEGSGDARSTVMAVSRSTLLLARLSASDNAASSGVITNGMPFTSPHSSIGTVFGWRGAAMEL
jgi:hypothetical protein